MRVVATIADGCTASLDLETVSDVIAYIRAHASQREELVEPIDTDDAIAALTQLDELRARYDERLTDLQMLAFKWMDAHDKLKAGLPYELPKPADVPDTMAQLDKLRAALEPFAKCAEQLKNRTDFGDKVIVSVGQTVLTLDDFNQARKALGGTNG